MGLRNEMVANVRRMMTKIGTGPPFTLTVTIHCPGVGHNWMCGGSEKIAKKILRYLSKGTEGKYQEFIGDLSQFDFCFAHCPARKFPDQPCPIVKIIKVDTLVLPDAGEEENE